MARIGVVIAGGAGRRVGGDKASALLGGRPLLSYAVDLVRAAGLDARVCAREDTALPATDAEVWREPARGLDTKPHPLAGLAHALGQAGEPIVALPVDLPFLPPEVLAALAARSEPLALLALDGRPASLVLRADPSHAPALAEAAAAGAPALRTLLKLGANLVELRDLDPTAGPDSLFNVNDAADLARAEQRLAARPQP
jgi:molybdopterin-guanine dinucleotide biosynthesis protein A